MALQRSQGRAEGEAKGRAKGVKEGRAEAQAEIALRMLAKKIPLTEIATLTGLSGAMVRRMAAMKQSK